MLSPGIVCVCAALTLSVKAVPVAESFADVAKVPVVLLVDAVVDPEVAVPVLLVALVITLEAAADPVSVPRVLLLLPLPSNTLSLRSGRPKVLEPSPVP